VEKHFVQFLSPGTLVSEETTLPVDAWDTEAAVTMAGDICERHGSRPYGFRFLTRARGVEDLDSKVVKRSGIYYLGGTVETAEEILARSDPKEEILRSNVRINGYKRIITNDNSWRFTTALDDDDVVLDVQLPPRAA
jgi:hypothetical protein